MKPTYFISDLHLAADLPRVTQGFTQLMTQIAGQATALYVLGDLFEVWVGDDNLSDYNQQIIAQFRQLSDQGTALYFVHGNRDFMLGESFAKACGGQLLGERTIIDIHQQRILIEHGDALCTKDEKFMAFRAQSRHPLWQQSMLAKPLAERVQIAELWRLQSKMQNSNKPENIMDVSPEEVTTVLNQFQVSILLHGHTHRPQIHQLNTAPHQSAQRIVLGDWREDTGDAIIGVADASGIRLETYTF
ncbi:UDP-2,3-diacylglucosamine diphosphatase [Agitococcus lubricus]|uniref:UDP-2,3-diacylglucosamine hydrolase n=1 Tax=Agitococcus lubricus TaxID=1077255 RepID=A0A2T5J1Q3_9GAMM|nr:UDP-2,3-diacylglucosamine diphosphatase [Agitococcus lubricus]PTQ90364.1 UDP-2,3-diacylglucosamine hydrolase [Agitococcus lubricus]